MKKRTLTILIAVVLVVACAVGLINGLLITKMHINALN